jgi:hypothetical protein
MIEIVLGIMGVVSIILPIIFFILGRSSGKKQNETLVNELNKQNSELLEKIESLETHNREQKEILEKSIQAVGALNKQNEMLINKVGSLESQISLKAPTPSVQKKGSEINKLLGELGFYLAKEYGKKKIDEWLYPDD